MSLILCRQEEVKNPLYIEALGIHIWSSQELCYVIYNYPLLAMDHLLDDSLTEFIEKELQMTVLSVKIQNGLRNGEDRDELIFMILEECRYYDTKEITAFRQKIATYRGMGPFEFAKVTADYYYSLRQLAAMKSSWTIGEIRRQTTSFWDVSGITSEPAMQDCSGLTRPCRPMRCPGFTEKTRTR